MLLSALTALPDEKLRQFALSLVLAGPTDLPRESTSITSHKPLLPSSETLPRARKDPQARRKPRVAKATVKKEAAKKKAA